MAESPIATKLKRVTMRFRWGCNYRCRMCPNLKSFEARPERNMALSLMQSIIQQAADAGATEFRPHAHGEPTQHPDFEAMCQCVADSNMGLRLDATNGSQLHQMSPDVFANPKFVRLVVSLDSATKETYARLRHPDMWEQVWKGLAFLRDNKQHMPTLQTTVRCILTRDTAEEMPRLPQRLAEYGVHSLQVTHLIEQPGLEGQNLQGEAEYVKDVSARIRAACEACDVVYLSRVEDTMDKLICCANDVVGNVCRSPFEEAWVTLEGDVTPCIQFLGNGVYAGNVFESTIQSVIQGAFFSRMRAQFGRAEIPIECSACPVWQKRKEG